MGSLSRADLMRLAAAALGVAWIVVLAAFVFAATSVLPGIASVAAAAAALLIAGTGILYAWRSPGR